MISSLSGTVTHVGLHEAVLDVHGVGLLVHATPATLSRLHRGEPASLQTHLVVREDSLTLFGFQDDHEREIFTTMLGVSGIGPRIALAVLSVHTPAQVSRAVAEGDDKAFSKVPGIGAKGARRIVLELAGKLVLPVEDPPGQASAGGGQSPGPVWRGQIQEALVGLGWSEKEAAQAVDSFIEHDPAAEQMSIPQALKAVLAGLGSTSSRGHRS